MVVKNYYYTKFRNQFNEFATKANPHYHPREGIFISIQSLNEENLFHITPKELPLFYCSVACSVLIDQLMHSHFKEDYPAFHGLTLYPKFEYGITGSHVNPWRIVQGNVSNTRLQEFFTFFVNDLEEFFNKYTFKNANWEKVKVAMLQDKDVVGGTTGEILKEVLNDK